MHYIFSGRPEDIPNYFAVSQGSFCSLDELQNEAESAKQIKLIYVLHCYKLFIAYWQGNLAVAEKHSYLAQNARPASRVPTTVLIYATFFRGLVSFQMYRQAGGKNRLKNGEEMMELMEKWAKLSPESMAVFGNKWHLIKAEYYSSVKDHDQALKMYEASIAASKDHGNIHELALGYELLGDYYAAHHRVEADVTECYKNAVTFYLQWGAAAVARRIMSKHSLDIDLVVHNEREGVLIKHAR